MTTETTTECHMYAVTTICPQWTQTVQSGPTPGRQIDQLISMHLLMHSLMGQPQLQYSCETAISPRSPSAPHTHHFHTPCAFYYRSLLPWQHACMSLAWKCGWSSGWLWQRWIHDPNCGWVPQIKRARSKHASFIQSRNCINSIVLLKRHARRHQFNLASMTSQLCCWNVTRDVIRSVHLPKQVNCVAETSRCRCTQEMHCLRNHNVNDSNDINCCSAALH